MTQKLTRLKKTLNYTFYVFREKLLQMKTCRYENYLIINNNFVMNFSTPIITYIINNRYRAINDINI